MEDLVTIPLFPLSLVAYPSKALNLHIFEPRYRQLIEECHAENKPFGIPTFQEGKALSFGTLMELEEISHTYPDGKMDVKTRGLRPFKVVEYYSVLKDKLYPGGEVLMMDHYDTQGSQALGEEVIELINKLYLLMQVKKKLPDWQSDFRIFHIADKLGLSLDQELNLLRIKEEDERLYLVKKHLLEITPHVENTERMKQRIKANGHFKNLDPPNFSL